MNFVLITPARNEARFIQRVIDSVVAQTARPISWIIVSDGSTDGMDAIVQQATHEHGIIRLIRQEQGGGRSFGSKAMAFRRGCEELNGLSFDFIGNLDADITLAPNYYESILHEMAGNPRLGIASGVCMDKTPTGFKKATISLNHAVGAVQFFRRECYEAIGGYQSVSVGGMDSLAELTARMKGWETRAFPHLPFFHHKPVDSAHASGLVSVCYRAGLTEYHIGTHPLFAVAKALRRWRDAPFIVSSFVRVFAYFKLWMAHIPRDASTELVAYLRKEQLARLRRFFLCEGGS